jgi:hypothetical protein
MKKVTFDNLPMALQTADDKWIVLFVLNNVEFSSTKIETKEEAMAVVQRVEERVKEWAAPGGAWVEELEDPPRLEIPGPNSNR